MDIEKLRSLCLSLPDVTEDIKWGNDLCFLINEKMFCVTGLNNTPFMISLKVTDEEFEELILRKGIIPAPYVARYKWVLIQDINVLPPKQIEMLISQSYELVKQKHKEKKVTKSAGKKAEKKRRSESR